MSVAPEHDVFRLDVAMHDARMVRGPERAANLKGDVERFRYLGPPSAEPHAQCLPIDKLCRNEANAVGFADVVNRQDVRMVEGRYRARFLAETPQRILDVGELGREDLQRDFATQPAILGQVDLPHAACSEPRQNPKVRDVLAFDGAVGHVRRLGLS